MQESIIQLWGIFLGTVLGLLPMMNPLAGAPTFLAITRGDTPEWRNEQARRACIYVVVILVGCLLCGSFVMNFFGISIPGLRIAGGILVASIGMKMVVPPKPNTGKTDPMHEAALQKRDISFSPLAMPLLSGPGSIGVTLGFTSLAKGWMEYVAISLGICVVAGVCYWVLRLSSRIGSIMGPNGLSAMTQMMGLLIMCMGVQFIVNGVLAIATDPRLVQAIRAAAAVAQ